MARASLLALLSALPLLSAACGPDDVGSGGSGGSGGAAGSTASATGGAAPASSPASSSAETTGGFTVSSSAASTGSGPPCETGPEDEDGDGDGFSELEGDCNDCDPGVNPKALEVVAEPGEDGDVPDAVDEDCDGAVDNVAAPCDAGLPAGSLDPMDAARAVGLCGFVKSAKWVLADGSPPPEGDALERFHLGHGILPYLGPKNPPREGARVLALSSGTARNVGDADHVPRNFDKGYGSASPEGFPKESPACGSKTGPARDATGIELEIEVPSNAKGFSFDFNFFSYEWPEYICRTFNDFFVAILEPFPEGQADGNISFDPLGNPISVNNAFIDVCGCPGNPPGACQTPAGKAFACSLGKAGLLGTDFELNKPAPSGSGAPPSPIPPPYDKYTNGSTGWLETSLGAEPGQVLKLRLVTYDSEDGALDSLALVDNWRWSAKPGTKTPVTKPPPAVPK